MEHKWETEEVDGGHLGTGHFFKCFACGASGGPDFGGKPQPPFLAGTGIKLSQDCAEAKLQVDKIRGVSK